MITDPRLAVIAEELEATGGAAEIYDREWRLVYLTSQFRFFAGNRTVEELGLGRHAVEIRVSELHGMVPDDASLRWLRTNIPLMAHDTPGGMDAIRAMLPDEEARALGPLELGEPQALWSQELTYLQPDQPPAQTRCLTFELPDDVGWVILYLPAAPASIVSLITRGNQGMFARMAELLQPARHETAILFADIQASSSARAPPLLAALVRADPRLPDRGRPGRHPPHRDRRPARRRRHDRVLPRRARRLARRGVRGGARGRARDRRLARRRGWRRGELRINVGVHWGGALYLGQVITGGRLEVTALGDEVNECARIQQSARDGALLASKPLVERLDPEHAEAFGLDPLTIMYRTVGELPGVTPKAVRDAGGIPVVTVPRQPAR